VCGLAGVVAAETARLERPLASALLGDLNHRGPDDRGWLTLRDGAPETGRAVKGDLSGEVVIVHTRLAIIDLTEGGRQPMASPDGRYWIAYNGEVYNYVELRAELERLGHVFRSSSDTEVLLAAYSEWGNAALSKLVGMFAFVIVDTVERRLILARDFFGMKPLYYSLAGLRLSFASEPRPLLRLPWVGRNADPRLVYDYLRFGLTDHTPGTLFRDIRQIPPAHVGVATLDRPTDLVLQRYWRPGVDTTDFGFEEAADRLRDLFVENVRIHMRSDARLGAALSGGIDSSSIVTAMRHVGGRGLDLQTFSHIADDRALNEERWIDDVAARAAAVKHKVQPTAADLVADLDRLVEVQGEPFWNTTMYAQHRVFRLAHDTGFKVLLDGQGADELLGGYRSFLAARLASLVRQGRLGEGLRFVGRSRSLPAAPLRGTVLPAVGLLAPTAVQRPLRRLAGRELMPRWLDAGWFRDRGVQPRQPWRTPTSNVLRDQLHQALTETSLPMLLRFEDRNSMSFSIESRLPFLTPQLADFVLSLPEQYILDAHGLSKAVFRRAMRGLVPDVVLDRRDKIGFATPEQGWLTSLGPWAADVLTSDGAIDVAPLSRDRLLEAWEAVRARRRDLDPRIWRSVNLVRWATVFDVKF